MLDLDMGKYAVFVWPAWAVTVLVLGGMVFDTVSRARRWKRELERREEDQA
jgi:heme exporter protein D